jgi:hypothetical protein
MTVIEGSWTAIAISWQQWWPGYQMLSWMIYPFQLLMEFLLFIIMHPYFHYFIIMIIVGVIVIEIIVASISRYGYTVSQLRLTKRIPSWMRLNAAIECPLFHRRCFDHPYIASTIAAIASPLIIIELYYLRTLARYAMRELTAEIARQRAAPPLRPPLPPPIPSVTSSSSSLSSSVTKEKKNGNNGERAVVCLTHFLYTICGSRATHRGVQLRRSRSTVINELIASTPLAVEVSHIVVDYYWYNDTIPMNLVTDDIGRRMACDLWIDIDDMKVVGIPSFATSVTAKLRVGDTDGPPLMRLPVRYNINNHSYSLDRRQLCARCQVNVAQGWFNILHLPVLLSQPLSLFDYTTPRWMHAVQRRTHLSVMSSVINKEEIDDELALNDVRLPPPELHDVPLWLTARLSLQIDLRSLIPSIYLVFYFHMIEPALPCEHYIAPVTTDSKRSSSSSSSSLSSSTGKGILLGRSNRRVRQRKLNRK